MVSAVSSSQPVTFTDPHPARIRVFYATIKVKKGNFPDYKRVFFDPNARAREAEGFDKDGGDRIVKSTGGHTFHIHTSKGANQNISEGDRTIDTSTARGTSFTRAKRREGDHTPLIRKSAGFLLVSYNTDISQQEAVDQASASQTSTPTITTARPATITTANDSALLVAGDW